MQSKHVAIDAPLLIALLQDPASKLGHVAGQPIAAGAMAWSSHFEVILSDIFWKAMGILPAVSQPSMSLPPGAVLPLPILTTASLHFWTIFVIVLTYFANSLSIVWRHLKSASAARATPPTASTMANADVPNTVRAMVDLMTVLLAVHSRRSARSEEHTSELQSLAYL